MINVKVYKDKDNKYIGYKVEGHSNYAEHGKDIVCASVSVLSQSVLLELQRKTNVSHKVENGYLEVNINSSDKDIPLIRNLINLLVTGISAIEEEYPDYVNLEVVNYAP